MKNIVGKLKKMLPYLAAAAVFILLAVVYCYPVLSGKVLKQGDIYQWKGMAQETIQYYEQTGKWSAWTNSMFSGMPTYQIAGGGSYEVTWYTKICSALSVFFAKLTHLFFSNNVLMLIIGYFVGFYILLSSFKVDKWLSIVGSIAITMSSYFFIIIVAGHESKALTLGLLAPVIAGFYLIFARNTYGEYA
jgi:hypothetical protein